MIASLFLLSILITISHAAPTPVKSYPVPNPTNGTCFYDGLTMADPDDERAFYQCCQHMWFLKYCLDGFVFDKYKLVCVPNNAPTNRHFHPTPPSQICTPGDKRPNPFDDSKFDECIEGTHWIPESCPSGFKFDPNAKECQMDPVPTTLSPNGSCQESMGPNGYKPNPLNCRTYFQCVHDEWQLRDCGPGTQWIQSILGCDYFNGDC